MTMQTDANRAAEVPLRIHVMNSVGSPRNWAEWVTLARKADRYMEVMGLLHGAFDFDPGHGEYDREKQALRYYGEERLSFFFELADQWGDRRAHRIDGRTGTGERSHVTLDRKSGRLVEVTESDRRQEIAQKCFGMLGPHFFSMPGTATERHDREDAEKRWMVHFISSGLFAVVQTFFKVEYDGSGYATIRNLYHDVSSERSHTETQATTFLLKLAHFVWNWKEVRIDSWDSDGEKGEKSRQNALLRGRIEQAKPWMLEVLVWLGELNVLNPLITTLDNICVAKLTEIALRAQLSRHSHPVTVHRTVKSLDEACYVNSRTAWFLKRREIILKEEDRLREIRSRELAAQELADKMEQQALQPE